MTAAKLNYRPPHERTSWLATLALILVSALFIYPFFWMALSAFKTNDEIYHPLQIVPEKMKQLAAEALVSALLHGEFKTAGDLFFAAFDFQYYSILFRNVYFPFLRVFGNSVVIAFGEAAGAVLVTSMAGYVFARHRFRGRKLLFLLAVVAIVMPQQALVVSLFDWIHTLHLFDNLLGVILPGLVSGLGVIYFTQVYKQIPDELFEAARLAGASEFAVYRTLLPLVISPLLSFGFIQFVLAWHEHLMPMLVLQTEANRTLPLSLATLYGQSMREPPAVLMAASMFTLLPVVILFCLVQRRFRNSLSELLVH